MLAAARDRGLRRRPARLAARACSTRCAEVRDRESRIDVLTRLAALNVLDPGDAELAELFEQELAAETDPGARLAVEAASLDALMMIPARHDERARRVAAIEPRRPRRIPCSRACSSRTARGSGSSSARPTRPRAPRSRSRRSTATCCCARPAGARPTTCACARSSWPTTPTRRARRSRACASRGDGARLAATARGRVLVRGRPRAAPRPPRRGREPRAPGARTSSTTTSTSLTGGRLSCCCAR